jgi:hypothetical protein
MEQLTPHEIPELLARLVDKSLVHYDPVTDRYRLLQLVAEFGREEQMRCQDSSRLRTKHLEHYARAFKGARERCMGEDQLNQMKQIEAEYENLRSATEWAVCNDDLWPAALSIARELHWFWFTRCYFEEGVRWMSSVMNAAPPGREWDIAGLACTTAAYLELDGSDQYLPWLEMGMSCALASGNSQELGRGTLISGIREWRNGNMPKARDLMQQAREIISQIPGSDLMPVVMVNLANLALFENRLDEAIVLYEETRKLFQEGNKRGMGVILGNLGQVWERKGDYKNMYGYELEALKCFMPLGDPRNMAGSIGACASGFIVAEDYVTAAQLLGSCEGIIKSQGLRFDDLDAQTLDRLTAKVKENLTLQAFQAALEAGAHLSLQCVFDFLVANPEPWANAPAEPLIS